MRRWTVWCLVWALTLCTLGAVPWVPAGQRHVHRQAQQATAVAWWPDALRNVQRWLVQHRQQAQLHGLFKAHGVPGGQDHDNAGHGHATAQHHSHAWNDGSVVAIDGSGDDAATQAGATLLVERLLGIAGVLAQALRDDLSQPPPAGATPAVTTRALKRLERPPRT